DALLKMSRASRGELRRGPLDLTSMATDALPDLRQDDQARRPAVEIQLGLHASGHSALVRNLLNNLLANAWKSTRGRDAARITVGGVGAGGERCFDTADSEVGFDDAYASKRSRQYQRLHAKDEFGGERSGLESDKRIIAGHGGSIAAEG